MSITAEIYLAVGVPWNRGWEVILLDPRGGVLATATARHAEDVEQVGRSLLRLNLPRGRRPVQMHVKCTPVTS